MQLLVKLTGKPELFIIVPISEFKKTVFFDVGQDYTYTEGRNPKEGTQNSGSDTGF